MSIFRNLTSNRIKKLSLIYDLGVELSKQLDELKWLIYVPTRFRIPQYSYLTIFLKFC